MADIICEHPLINGQMGKFLLQLHSMVPEPLYTQGNNIFVLFCSKGFNHHLGQRGTTCSYSVASIDAKMNKSVSFSKPFQTVFSNLITSNKLHV